MKNAKRTRGRGGGGGGEGSGRGSGGGRGGGGGGRGEGGRGEEEEEEEEEEEGKEEIRGGCILGIASKEGVCCLGVACSFSLLGGREGGREGRCRDHERNGGVGKSSAEMRGQKAAGER